MRNLFEVGPFQGHDPLIAAGIASLVDSHRQRAAAEKCARRGQAVVFGEAHPVGVEPRIGTHAPFGAIVHHQHVDRPVG